MTEIDYVFVIFKHVDTLDLCMQIFKKELMLVKCFRFCLCMKSQTVNERMFLNHELTVSQTVDPEEILWENLESKGNHYLKQVCLYGFTLFLATFAFAVIVCIEAGRRAIESHMPFKRCPTMEIKKTDAYLDHINPQLTVGLLHCYCRNLYDN